jgi:hypothetical protein
VGVLGREGDDQDGAVVPADEGREVQDEVVVDFQPGCVTGRVLWDFASMTSSVSRKRLPLSPKTKTFCPPLWKEVISAIEVVFHPPRGFSVCRSKKRRPSPAVVSR